MAIGIYVFIGLAAMQGLLLTLLSFRGAQPLAIGCAAFFLGYDVASALWLYVINLRERRAPTT